MMYPCPHNNIKVTVGICVKNSQMTIEEALESVLNQNFPHELVEIIVVDGCSKDRTLKIVETSLSETDIQSKIFQDNKGLGQARQMVVDQAAGDYIVWVDGDMVLSKEFLGQQIKFMDETPDAGIAKGKYGISADEQKESLVATLENLEFLIHTMTEGKTESKALGASGCIYRTQAVRAIGGFDKDIAGAGEDNDVEYRIRAAGWANYITKALFYEKRRQTWRSLWQEYFWHGYGWPALLRKNRDSINLSKMLPPVAITTEVMRLPKAYSLMRQRRVFLLPLHYVFKRTAWILGLLRGRMDALKR
jgi:glycosyltransferase involved in cell wall biosynthesis